MAPAQVQAPVAGNVIAPSAALVEQAPMRAIVSRPVTLSVSQTRCLSQPKTAMSLLQGKKALLTGASRGIGAAIACALAKEGASLTLVAHPHHEQDLKQVGAA